MTTPTPTPVGITGKGSCSGRSFWPWLGWALLVLVADQITKVLIMGAYSWGDSTPITSFFNIVRAHNTGAAFSFLAEAGGWQRWLFTGIGIIATVIIVVQLRKHPEQKLFCFALASILGGAIGNVIDRVAYGYVVDFLDFHWDVLAGLFYRGHFPAFNIADMGITVGATLLIVDEFRRSRAASAAATSST